MLRNCRALKTSESEDVVVSPFRNKFKILSRTLVGMSGILMDSREDGESFKMFLSTFLGAFVAPLATCTRLTDVPRTFFKTF